MGFKFSAKYAGSDTEMGGARKEETNFLTYARGLLIASQCSKREEHDANLFVDLHGTVCLASFITRRIIQ